MSPMGQLPPAVGGLRYRSGDDWSGVSFVSAGTYKTRLSNKRRHFTVKKSKRIAWTSVQIRELKALAKRKTPAGKIAKSLKRSEGATRQKAFSLGVSLELPLTLGSALGFQKPRHAMCAGFSIRARPRAENYSLFGQMLSLISGRNSLFDCIGNLARKPRISDTTCADRALQRPSFANFPVIFPDIREFGAETG